MKKMKASPSLLLLLLICLLPLSLTLSYQEDDLVFDDVGEETPTLSTEEQQQQQQQSTASSITKNKKWQRVERLLGMPNAVATVGHVFKLHIPKQAFAGSIDYYEARGNNGKGLPHWLRWDEPAYAFYGVPSRKDIGRHRVTVKAFGKRGDVAQDSFIIHVVPEKREYFNHKDGKKHCTEDQDLTMLTILIDAKYENLKPSAKVNALENLAGFLGLRTNLFSIQPELNKDGPGNPYNGGSSVVLSGPGNVARRREKHSTIVQWQVGCDGHFWPHQINTIKLIPEQARDGTLSEVMQLPVYQWRVRSDAIDYARNRRDIAGSGSDLLPVDEDDDEYDEEEEYDDDDNDDYNEGITESPEPKLPKPVVHGGLVDEPKQSKPVLHGGVVDEHPHRHHHGEDSIAGIGAGVNNEEDIIWRNADLNNAIFNQTPTTTTTTTTTTPSTYTEASVPARESSSPFGTTGSWNENATEKVPGEPLDPYDSINVPVYSSTQSTTTSTTTEPTTTSTEAPTTTTKATTVVLTTESTTTTTTTTTTPSTTTPEPTTTSTTPSTTTTTTTTTPTTERIDYGVNVYNTYNKPPKIERRLKKLSVTQGKPLSYIIPEDTFSDPENGNTRNLRLRIYENGAPLKPSYWLQFNEETQEIYGLPLQSEYGPYPFEVIAMDNEGNTVSEKLEVSVQQHKQTRTVNHQFHLYLKIEKKSEFPTNVDWELKVLRSLGELYGDSDLSYITVLNVDEPIGDQAIYSWTNDSLVRTNSCPVEEINRLYRVLVSDVNTEEPSEALMDVLGPEIRPKRIVYEGFEQCQEIKETQRQKEYPFTRNQIDQVNATAGQLFVYKVPQDTFFDESDGDTRRLRVYLLTANRTEIPSSDWLQFDSNNQEFFGVPLKQDIGRRTYQLIARDSDGLEGIDSLIAEVRPSPIIRHVVEISMTLNMPYEVFANSAGKKREFIEKLQKLYGDRNVSAISLLSISGNRDTTTVTWRNLTLPTDECPHDEITRLRRVLVNDNKSFTDELNREFNSNSQQPEFSVIQITVSQMGACQGPVDFGPEMPPIDDSTSVGASHDDYLITFVLPAIIIAAMLILAGIIACILYKRRRSGKMSVSEKDDERQSFRSKGIPVIFQDELDEKPDPGNKSPIILKEEKPPLPPPEYQRAEDGADIPMLSKENSEEPYQPPPPFATNRDNNRQNRPKPTPTYRKPPPYVPP